MADTTLTLLEPTGDRLASTGSPSAERADVGQAGLSGGQAAAFGRPGAWVALALLVAAAFRLVGLGDWPLWLDEAWSRWMSEQGWAQLRASAAAYDTHPPVYYSALKLWRAVAGDGALALRLLSALAGLGTVAIVYACARRWEPLRAAPWLPPFAAALAAASLPLIVAARQARPYALWTLAASLALWAALELLRSRPGRSWRSRVALWTGYALALEAVLWLHSLGALFAAALAGGLALGLLARGGWRRDVVPYLLAHGAAGLAFLPGLLVILEHRRNWKTSWLSFDLAAVPDGLASGLAVPGPIAVPLFALAIVGAATALRRPEWRPGGLLLISLAATPAAVTVLLSILSSPVFLPRTLVPSAVPMLLLAAAGAGTAGHAVVKRGAAAACLAMSLLISALAIRGGPQEPWHQVAPLLEARVATAEEVWLLPNELALPLGYALGESPRFAIRGVPAPFPAPQHPGPRPSGTPAVPPLTDAEAARLIAEARTRGVRAIWLISRWSTLFDRGDTLRSRLNGGAVRAPSRTFGPLLVERYPLSLRTGARFVQHRCIGPVRGRPHPGARLPQTGACS